MVFVRVFSLDIETRRESTRTIHCASGESAGECNKKISASPTKPWDESSQGLREARCVCVCVCVCVYVCLCMCVCVFFVPLP